MSEKHCVLLRSDWTEEDILSFLGFSAKERQSMMINQLQSSDTDLKHIKKIRPTGSQK
jgi:hypothetical protein